MAKAELDTELQYGKLHVGILITASTISMLVGRLVEAGPRSSAPFEFEPYEDGAYDHFVGFNDVDEAQNNLAVMVGSLVLLPEAPVAIGIASYGPLQSVGIQMRNRTYFDQRNGKEKTFFDFRQKQRKEDEGRWCYGVVGATTPHLNLQGLDIYGIVREQLRSSSANEGGNTIGVAVNTDVTCGALCEAFHSGIRDRTRPGATLKAEDDTVVFLNLAEGVGGGFVVNKATTGSANHPEMGYVTLALTSKSDQAALIFVEDEASVPTILKKSGKPDWEQMTEDDWLPAVNAIAQLCATITFIISPHQIVLHGPVSRLTKKVNGQDLTFAQLVRRELDTWMSVGRGAPNSVEQRPYVEYREMTAKDFIASSYKPRWSTKAHKKGRVDPMLYGALIYGAQIPPEEIKGRSHG